MPRDAQDNPPHTSAALEAVVIDRDGEVPVGVQLAWTLRARIGEGRPGPGERLPGLREMAETSGLNVNTVRSVYQRLEHEGLIDSQQGSGTFVAAAPRPHSLASSIAARAARAAVETGVDPREVAAALYVSPSSGERPAVGRGAERRRALREQIAALELTLGDMEVAHPGLVPARSRRRAGPGPSLPSAVELEQVRTQLLRRLLLLRDRIDDERVSQGQQAAPPGRAQRAAVKSARPLKQAGDPKATGKSDGPKRTHSPRPSTRPAPAGS
jgi:DNA-binding transcriptional regulator YhcF (GntR family)